MLNLYTVILPKATVFLFETEVVALGVVLDFSANAFFSTIPPAAVFSVAASSAVPAFSTSCAFFAPILSAAAFFLAASSAVAFSTVAFSSCIFSSLYSLLSSVLMDGRGRSRTDGAPNAAGKRGLSAGAGGADDPPLAVSANWNGKKD